MLEIRSLRKVYRPRRGVPVTALDDVSLTFGDRGMVFLLGKSGSGKSTLLNLLGGLDRFDSGELIIKGVSSANFRQRDFDSYRNTYVGFIFQEYNILEEFSVGANIALALELQGRKATDEQINAILAQVDLTGYGDRKPNELSGGQKQRVAIARALVKNPEIIMADEPTGALDSETGRQVLETLKKLSADKLVLVVSHDREFAERYADRIVELADGKVIRDVERSDAETLPADGGLAFGEDGIQIPPRYRLTEADREAINAYLEAHEKGTVLSPAGAKAAFVPTDASRIRDVGASAFRLIKSKLPMKNAVKIGASSLKHKKFRLAVTLVLSVVAFTLFGLSDTFGSYDHIRACTDSLKDSNITYASVTRQERIPDTDSWTYHNLTDADIRQLSEQTGIRFNGVYQPDWLNGDMLSTQFDAENGFRKDQETDEIRIYATSFSGFAELTEKTLDEFGFSMVAGRLPESGKQEIAVSRFVYETFQKGGYRADATGTFEKIEKPADLVGKTLAVGYRNYTVCGVVETHYDRQRYASLAENAESDRDADLILKYALSTEMSMEQQYSLSCMAFVGEGEVVRMASHPVYYESDVSLDFNTEDYAASFSAWTVNRLDNVPAEEITWFGSPKDSLGEKEVLVNPDYCYVDGDTSGWTADDWREALNKDFSRMEWTDGAPKQEPGWTVVGLYSPSAEAEQCQMVLSDSAFDRFVTDADRYYDYAVAPMPSGQMLSDLVQTCYDRDGDVQYHLNNPPCFELDTLRSLFDALAKVFLWMGVFFAAFSGLLLANFIATSIAYKKQEIGILRAIGSRGADVFRIFFSESFIIASFNAVTACILTAMATFAINMGCRAEGLRITVLHFGVRQALLLIAVSVAVAVVASFIPVKRIASKRPIDAIHNK